jgi:hypothetical protein
MADAELVAAYRKVMRLGIGHGLDASVNPIPADMGEQVGKRLDLVAKKLSAQLEHSVFKSPEIRAAVNNKVRDWMEQEGTIKLSTLATDLEPLVGGVRALMIARTETGWAYNAAAAIGYQAAGFTHVRWIASPAACEICLDLDGDVFEVEEYVTDAIAHPNCSCGSEPIEPGEGEEGNAAPAEAEDYEHEGESPAEAVEGVSPPPDRPTLELPDDELASFGHNTPGGRGERIPEQE